MQVEIGSVVMWKYLFCILCGDEFQGEFYLIVIVNNMQQVDIGIKMIYFGKNICLCIVFKGIFVGKVQNIYCGLVMMYFCVINSCNYM